MARFDGPVLWFLAELDENVPFVSTRTALERAFAESPGNDEELVVIEDSPHSFIIPSEQGPSLYAEGFFEKMAVWMTRAPVAGTRAFVAATSTGPSRHPATSSPRDACPSRSG